MGPCVKCLDTIEKIIRSNVHFVNSSQEQNTFEQHLIALALAIGLPTRLNSYPKPLHLRPRKLYHHLPPHPILKQNIEF